MDDSYTCCTTDNCNVDPWTAATTTTIEGIIEDEIPPTENADVETTVAAVGPRMTTIPLSMMSSATSTVAPFVVAAAILVAYAV